MKPSADRPSISWRAQWFGLRRLLKMQIAGPLRVAFNVLLFLVIGLSLGFGSARYATENGFWATTQTVGSWASWTALGRTDADPYTRAFAARRGLLALASTHTRYFFANRDSNGAHLVPTCSYAVEGAPIKAQWWSLGAYTDDGRLIANAAQRHAVESPSLLRGSDGRFAVTVSQRASSGNWLPTGNAASLTLVMQVIIARDDNVELADQIITQLPTINRLGCR